jgi:hypothetical protein
MLRIASRGTGVLFTTAFAMALKSPLERDQDGYGRIMLQEFQTGFQPTYCPTVQTFIKICPWLSTLFSWVVRMLPFLKCHLCSNPKNVELLMLYSGNVSLWSNRKTQFSILQKLVRLLLVIVNMLPTDYYCCCCCYCYYYYYY